MKTRQKFTKNFALRFTNFLLISVLLLFVSYGAEASYKDEGNNGSSSKPYIIDSVEDLQELQTNVNNGTEPSGKYYKLTTDLNISPFTTWEPIGYDSSKPFKGHFNGNGKILYVNINREIDKYIETGAGLFGYLEPGSDYAVKNLTVSGTIKGYSYVAGIAQVLVNGTVENCTFTGNLYCEYKYLKTGNRDLRAGGIIGILQSGTIKNCTVKKGNIYSILKYFVYEQCNYAGGIAALMNGGLIENCNVLDGSALDIYTGLDDDDTYVGGIVGLASLNNSTTEGIKNCKFTGTIKAEAEEFKNNCLGGIIGSLSGGIVDNCQVLSGSTLRPTKHYQTGGIAGELLVGGVIQSCTVEAGVALSAAFTNNNLYSLGGIIGVLDIGTVRSNNFYGILSGNASYVGGIIGSIKGNVTKISSNKFANATNGIGFDSIGLLSNEGCTHVYEPTITTESLGGGKTGTAYSKTLKATGMKTITWSISDGKLPNGLSLSSDGKITGTPTKTGTFTFTVKAENVIGSDEKELSIKISKATTVTINITTSKLNNAVVGKAYNAQLQATSNPVSTLTWSISSGTLPNGMSLSSDGKLTGTPTTSSTGTFIFTVKAAYSSYSAYKEFSMTVEPKVTIKTTSLKDAVESKSYSVTLSATGASPITWKKSAGTLPNGIKITSAGKITGTPTETGTFSFTVKASYSSISYATKKLSLTVNPKVTVTTSSLSKGSIGTAYTATLKATGNPKITWTITKGSLPNGLALAKAGEIIGIPEKAGTFSFTVKAQNSYDFATKSLKLVINNGKPSITTSSLSNGTVGEAYNVTLKASGTAPFTWTRSSGSLPNGLGLSTAGRIIGVPTKAGTFSFTLKVKNSLGTATKTLKIVISEETETTAKTSKSKDKDSSSEDEIVTVENQNDVVTNEGIKFGTERNTASIPQSILNSISDDKKMIAAILPEVIIDEYGLYVFENVSLDAKVPEGWKLSWLSCSNDNLNASEAEEADAVEFFDDEGETLSGVPENRNVNVSVGLSEGTYYPLIIAEENNESSTENENSSSSGGCNTGFSSILLLAGFLILRRKKII